MTADDMELVQEYARHKSESAFAALVSRHVNLVYSVSLRQLGDSHQAEEVTQATFIILARKAGSLGPKTILPAWLCRTAQYPAAGARRTQRRRQSREQEVYLQSMLNQAEPTSSPWPDIAPLLDVAMARLGEKDHSAIVLRYFEGKDLKQVGAALGVTENAAKTRVSRAVEKLRRFFIGRGITLSATVIAGAIAANSIQAAPVTLARSVTAVAITKAAADGTTLTIVKGALKLMTWTKVKTTAVAGIVVLFVAGTTTVTLKDIQEHKKNRQISTSLLTLHEDWASNGYRATHTPLPTILAEQGEVRTWSAGILGAYVQYSYEKDGVEWTRMFHISRTDTNTTTWTLSEFITPTDTNLSRMARERTLCKVTGEP